MHPCRASENVAGLCAYLELSFSPMNANSGKSDTGHDAKPGALIRKVAVWMFMRAERRVAAIVAFGYEMQAVNRR